MTRWIKIGPQDSQVIALKDFNLPTFWTILREELKVGSGVACSTENRLHTELVMEAVLAISNMSTQNTTCIREYGDKTEVPKLVPWSFCFCFCLFCCINFTYLLIGLDDNNRQFQVLYFKDFSPSTMSQSSMKALKSIDWKRYGLHLGRIVEQDGIALLEWENLPTDTHIDIVLHSYLKQYPTSETAKHIVYFYLFTFLSEFLDALLQDFSLDFLFLLYLYY